MELIEDIGLKPTGRIRSDTGKPEFKRYYLVRCSCSKIQEILMSDFKRRPDSTCKECSGRRNATKHGKRFTPLYDVFISMKSRCYSKTSTDYIHYGGRGISICKEWLEDFLVFEKWATMNGYRKGLSIDRKDNDLNYTPDNCRWVEQTIQTRNSRVLRSTNTSGYRGVNWNKEASKWVARITVKPTRISLGYFDTAIEAAIAYDTYVVVNNLEHNRNGVI